MRWKVESLDGRLTRLETWSSRFALVPHLCANPACGTMVWLEVGLSKMVFCDDAYRVWACSSDCAKEADFRR